MNVRKLFCFYAVRQSKVCTRVLNRTDCHFCGYLKLYPKRKIVFDAAHPSIDQCRFKKYDWYNFYRGTKEAISSDCPEPLGNSMSTHCFVDDDLAGNLISRRSQTVVLIFCNRAPIIWHRKQHNAVETSKFGSEMMVLKIVSNMSRH